MCKNASFWQSQRCAIKIFKANLVALLNSKSSISSIFLLVQLILTDFAKEIVYAAAFQVFISLVQAKLLKYILLSQKINFLTFPTDF